MNASLFMGPLGLSLDGVLGAFRLCAQMPRTRTAVFLDTLVDPLLGELLHYPHCVLECMRSRRAVADDCDAFQTQQRSTAVFGVVEALLEFVKGGLRE